MLHQYFNRPGASRLLRITFPPSDGGHVLFYSIEGIFGKPVPVRICTKLAQVFFLLFVFLMFYGLFNDIFKPIRLG